MRKSDDSLEGYERMIDLLIVVRGEIPEIVRNELKEVEARLRTEIRGLEARLRSEIQGLEVQIIEDRKR